MRLRSLLPNLVKEKSQRTRVVMSSGAFERLDEVANVHLDGSHPIFWQNAWRVYYEGAKLYSHSQDITMAMADSPLILDAKEFYELDLPRWKREGRLYQDVVLPIDQLAQASSKLGSSNQRMLYSTFFLYQQLEREYRGPDTVTISVGESTTQIPKIFSR